MNLNHTLSKAKVKFVFYILLICFYWVLLKEMLPMFFFFFDSETINDIIKICLNSYIRHCIETKGYCDVSELFSDSITQKDVKEQVVIRSEAINRLYKKYPRTKDDLYILSNLYYEVLINRHIDSKEAFAVLFWCFKVFKNDKKYKTKKDEILQEFMSYVNDTLQETRYVKYDSIVYDDNESVINVVNSVSDFLSVLNKYSENETLYFRGHSKTTYQLKPSIMRTAKLQENENLIYQELLISCPDDFRAYKNHIDYLVKMQHYGLPTRLLDITRNPLVALYFACCSNVDDIGEVLVFSPKKKQVKYENSDTVSMLASLPLFSYEDQMILMDNLYVKQNEYDSIVQRFIHELQTEKPGFVNKINYKDLEGCFIVLPKKDNSRIVKQDGAFIICGINNSIERVIYDTLRLTHNQKTILIFVTNKKQIIKELDILSINKSTLFLEIDYVAEYIKTKYCS